MNNVILSWVLPSVSNRQRPIAVVVISARVSSDLAWTEIARVEAPGTELTLEDVAPGTWFYQATVVDTDAKLSDAAYAEAAVPFDAPSVLVDFGAALA